MVGRMVILRFSSDVEIHVWVPCATNTPDDELKRMALDIATAAILTDDEPRGGDDNG